MSTPATSPTNFIRNIIDDDVASGKNGGRVVTRFPPEPNGYLHIGHAKSICLQFALARDYGGQCNLRFDDTNPLKEDVEYIRAIQDDIRWLGFDWGTNKFHASDYFGKMYDCAETLIGQGKAYVCSLSADQVREYRGTLTEPGRPSPDRDAPVEKNHDLFRRMRASEFADGTYTLRAKIDMTSGNINLRDPALYRIRKATHPHVGDAWCIYPMYDYAHCISDHIEGITHSLCTLEFEDHRPLYDWILDALRACPHPQQIEFSKLRLNYTVMGKRWLKYMVDNGVVSGWDDPRMPTLQGLRRRGVPPAAIRTFVERVGISKKDSVTDFGVFEDCIRDELNTEANRALAVLDPVKLVITDWPEGEVRSVDAPNHPLRPENGTRALPFGRTLYVERADYMENAPSKFFRLSEGKEVRLRYGCVVKCVSVVKDAQGNVTEIHCTHDAATFGADPVGRKVKGIIHWVSAQHAVPAEIRVYDRLFRVPFPSGDAAEFLPHVNPESLTVLGGAFVEASLANARPEERFQFERNGYFAADRLDHSAARPVFNRVVTLRDSWAKETGPA